MSECEFRVVLRHDKDELTGTINFPASPALTLEALASIIEAFAAKCQVTPQEVLKDLSRITQQ